MRHIYLIRHAESYSNAGLPTEEPGTYPITDAGKAESERFAQVWAEEPQLIITSPYLRTQMTAEPMRAKYPKAAHDEWKVQEWTFLCPSRYKGSTFASRQPHVREFWERNDPMYQDGGGAESYMDLMGRVALFRQRLRPRQEKQIVIFTHGHFMRAVVWSHLYDRWRHTPETMARFRKFTEAMEIPNLAVLSFHAEAIASQWTMAGLRVLGAGAGTRSSAQA